MNQVQEGVEAQGIVEERKDDLTLYRTGHLDGTQREISDDTVVATQLDEIVVALGRKEGRNQRPVVLHRRQGYSPRRLNEHQS